MDRKWVQQSITRMYTVSVSDMWWCESVKKNISGCECDFGGQSDILRLCCFVAYHKRAALTKIDDGWRQWRASFCKLELSLSGMDIFLRNVLSDI